MREKLIEKVFMFVCVGETDRETDSQTEEISKLLIHFLSFYPPVDEHNTRKRIGDGSNRLCSQIKKRKGIGTSIGHCN